MTEFSIDETGVTTVQKVTQVVATKCIEHVGQITSREHVELMTVCVIVSASGQTLSPVFVFPCKDVKGFMMNDSPKGSLSLVDSSGWMTEANLIKMMKHFTTNAVDDEKCRKADNYISATMMSNLLTNSPTLVPSSPTRATFNPISIAALDSATGVMRSHRHPLWCHSSISLETQLRVYQASVLSVLYRSECWPISTTIV